MRGRFEILKLVVTPPHPGSLRDARPLPAQRGEVKDGPRKPTLDEMGPGPDKESKPYRPGLGPRSTGGKAGTRAWRQRKE